jgi:hypothetical protein
MSTIGCLERPQAPVQPAPDPATGAANPYLTDWKVLGPFSWTSQERDAARLASGLDQPLAPFESQVISGRADLSPPASSTSFWQPKPARAENGEVRLHALLSSDGFQGAYAVTDVPSANETDAALLVEADDGVRVYLNGRLVHENTSSRRLQQFEDYVPVRLRKGTNQIALKLVTGDKRGGYWNSWSFAVGLRSLSAARQERAARNYLQELTTSVVTDGRLGLDLRLFERERMITVEIRDGASRLIRRVDLRSGDRRTVDVGDLPDGAYQVRLPESAAPEDFPFYKGNVATAQVALRKRGEELGLYNPRDPNLGALEQRLARVSSTCGPPRWRCCWPTGTPSSGRPARDGPFTGIAWEPTCEPSVRRSTGQTSTTCCMYPGATAGNGGQFRWWPSCPTRSRPCVRSWRAYRWQSLASGGRSPASRRRTVWRCSG